MLLIFAGMFLYARIVLDNAELFSSLDEIEGELKALPEDLNEAWVPNVSSAMNKN